MAETGRKVKGHPWTYGIDASLAEYVVYSGYYSLKPLGWRVCKLLKSNTIQW